VTRIKVSTILLRQNDNLYQEKIVMILLLEKTQHVHLIFNASSMQDLPELCFEIKMKTREPLL